MSRAIHETSIDARVLHDRLIQSKPGDEISYAELSKVVGRNVQDQARGALDTARRMAMRDHHAVFGTIRGDGLKRLADIEIVQTGDATVTKIRRVAKRGIKVISSIEDFAALPNEAKVKHNTFASMFGAIAALAKPSSVKRVEAAVNTAQTGELPIGRTLEIFTNGA